MAPSTDHGNGPPPSRRERRFRPSGTAALLGAATSAAVLYAGATGAFTAPLAVAAAFSALVVAAISTRHSRSIGELLPPLSAAAARRVVIDAPRASEVAGKTSRTDAA